MKYELSRALRGRNRKARTTFRPNVTLLCKPNFKKKIRGGQNNQKKSEGGCYPNKRYFFYGLSIKYYLTNIDKIGKNRSLSKQHYYLRTQCNIEEVRHFLSLGSLWVHIVCDQK